MTGLLLPSYAQHLKYAKRHACIKCGNFRTETYRVPARPISGDLFGSVKPGIYRRCPMCKAVYWSDVLYRLNP